MSQGTDSGVPYRSEVHRSLRIPEVVNQICSRLSPVPGAGAAVLAALARTSTLFHDAALDGLWGHQATFMNLIHCMPSDLWEIVEPPGALRLLIGPVLVRNGLPKPTRPIVTPDWDRPLKYACRVKTLQLTNGRDPSLVEFFRVLRLGVPGGHLLPNLQHLLWGYSAAASFGYSESVLPFIDLFLGPHIESIGIGDCQKNAHYSLLPDLARKYPALKGVAIVAAESSSRDDDDNEEADDAPSGPPPADQLSTFVRALTHVKALVVGTLDLPALFHLGGLQTLELFSTQLPPSLSFPQSIHQTLFPRLRDIKIFINKIRMTNGDILALTEFVRTWNNPALESFDVEFTNDSNRDFTAPVFALCVEEFHRVLGAHCAADSLKTFGFHIPDEEWHSDVGEFVYPGHCLKSLFGFSNLISVTIRVLHGFDIDDAVVSDLARTWPYLQQLSLETDSHEPTPHATLRALQALAQHCGELRILKMTFDATTVPPPVTPEEPQITQRNLVFLDAAFSRIATAFPVARFLSGTFINLKTVNASYSTAQYHSKWSEVGVFLPQLLEIREEERARGHNAALQNTTSSGASIALE
ncbi:hypothetical protein B0H19DRAFT_1234466 [Mycena capillaripes]|nr:hypothetical protein B0H19DRAFT_1234466 [Mycena capillaripes]